MNPLLPVAVLVQRLLVDIPCQIDEAELAHFPAKGPLLAAGNHISSLEVPIMLSHMFPKPITGMAKFEAWSNPFYWMLYKVYRAVPVRRGEADLAAMDLCMQRLKEGYILAVAPEGTRSYDGQMRQGHPGVALLAVRSGAPIQPFAHFGGEDLWKNLRRFKRTPFHIRVGNPFHIDLHGERMNKIVSQRITDEIMYQVAAMLPPSYRGYYGQLEKATEDFLCFAPGVTSNLARSQEYAGV
jgi:1-acyl-sn-glycerol-3-phosphate acyltransferase